jgi:hypothetical protein
MRVIKEADFSRKHKDNSDEVSDEESQASDKFHYTNATTDTKKVHLYKESYLSMALHGLVNQVSYSILSCLWQWLQQN